MAEIVLKSVSELLEMKFFIPSYQRGYRWGKLQIESLINDIYDFDKSSDGEFYCLQPLMVKLKNEPTLKEIKDCRSVDEVKSLLKGTWTVIDGQQRLTTIYLILKAFDHDSFSIEYERDSDNIKMCDYDNEIKNDNIEIFHLTTAKDIINKWKNPDPKDKNVNPKNIQINNGEFLFKLLNQTKFIFYNVGNISDEQEHDLFNNINSGKIALTNAELIKALFLNKVGYEDIAHREVEQRLLADEFDQIERALRQDAFWYFLAGNADKPSSCINLLFDLMFEADEKVDKKKYPEYEKFRTFFYFNDKINKGNRNESYRESKVLWEEVRRAFHIMEGWFNDSVMYNLIGYHRAVNAKLLATIYTKFNESKTKQDFKNWLVEECKECIPYPDEFMNLRYDTDKAGAFNLLLLFNIATLLKKPQEHVKFSFASFLTHKWDVEHISPQNPKDDSLQLPENELMSIGNLTLLTDHVNRGISNGNYEEKRNAIQKYYRQGCYIPLCSMNVFMKFYSKNPTQFLSWDENDREDYAQEIHDTIEDFFTPKTKGTF